jgi:hypothetical protein
VVIVKIPFVSHTIIEQLPAMKAGMTTSLRSPGDSLGDGETFDDLIFTVFL